MAQTTVLIGVNPCLTEGYLKKQSQFIRAEYRVQRTAYTNLKKQSQFSQGQNERKYLYER